MSDNRASSWYTLAKGIAVIFVLVGVGRIASTYHTFNQAYDEPAHIACGMEWLDKGTFKIEPQHPPLPRVAVALGPYLAGLRLPEIKFREPTHKDGYDFYTAGNEILYAEGKYGRNLTLARMGTLPFFVLTAFVTFVWARSLLGEWPAVLAVFFVTTLPTILGYCTLAYVDPALLAFLPVALFAFVRWLDSPNWGRSLILGTAVAGALLSNTPAMVFLPPCVVAILVCRWWARRGTGLAGLTVLQSIRQFLGDWTRPAAIVVVATCFVLWAGYRFSVQPMDQMFEHPAQSVRSSHLPSPVKAVALKLVALNPSLPAPEFLQGVYKMLGENSKLYPSYIFGKVKRGGWWYFYPVMLAFKTPPVFLLLAILGTGWTLTRFFHSEERDWKMAAPAACVLAILFIAMLIKVNIGVRHVLFLYPLFAILATFACVRVWELRSRWPRVVPRVLVALLVWLAFSTAWIHPNYLTYTSALAGRHPDKNLLLDADFDAGQNILQLSQELADRGVKQVHLRLYTSADLTKMNLPPFELLEPNQRATGWIAISLHNLHTGESPWNEADRNSYKWLNGYPGVADVNKTIRLFYVPEGQQQSGTLDVPQKK